MTLLMIALGGAIGSVLRYGVTLGAARAFGAGFPFGTLAVNVLGGFAMGLAYALLIERGPVAVSPAIMAGLLGGFTTFSAFSLETVLLAEAGRLGTAALYVLVSVVLSIGALMVGLMLARAV